MAGESFDGRRRAGRTVARAGLALALLGTSVLWLAGSPAAAATTIFSQTADIAVPLSGGANQGAATPYPSTITVPAGTPALTTIAVTLEGLSHAQPNDVDMMLVGPTGVARLLMSDAGGAPPNGVAAPGINLRFVVSGSPAIPSTGPLVAGTYVPANYTGGTDSFPAPAPASGGVGLAGFVGTSPVGTWSLYIVDDGNGQRGDLLGWSLELGSANDAPVADDDAYPVAEDGTLTVNAANGVLDGDTDPDGDTLTAGSPVGPSNGTLSLAADGSFNYAPNANVNGSDSFTYTVSDGNGGSDTGTVTITITAVNDAPVADDDTHTVAEDGTLTVDAGSGLLDGDSDVDGDTLTVTAAGPPASGALAVAPDGSLTYTPAADFVGTFSVSYTVSDGNGGSDTGTVTITVGPNVNDDPVADDDPYTVAEDGTLTVDAGSGLLDGDSDVEGDTLTVTAAGPAANGALAVAPDGSFTYTPDAHFNGADSFTYQVVDGNGGLATATVSITVTPVADPPAADDDTYGLAEDTTLTVPSATGVLDGDSDPDGDALTATVLAGPTVGTLALNSDGSFSYTPPADYSGIQTFTYTVADGNGGTAVGTVTLMVAAANDTPVADDDAYTVAEDGVLTVTAADGVLDGDVDIDGDALAAGSPVGPSNGTLSLAPDGGFTYTPAADVNGSDSFTYTVDDGQGGTDTGAVTITVTPVNDAPVAAPDSATTDAGDPVTIDVAANDDDPDGDTLAVSLATSPSRGTATCGSESCTFSTADGAQAGVVTFDYTVSDGAGADAAATVTVTIRADAVTPTTPTTATSVPTTAPATQTPAAPTAPTAAAVAASTLPRTGASTTGLVAVARVLLVLGLLALAGGMVLSSASLRLTARREEPPRRGDPAL